MANAITAGGWAVEVAWLEIECVSIVGVWGREGGITLLVLRCLSWTKKALPV